MSKRYEGVVWEPWLAAKKTESKAGTIDLIDRVWRIRVKPKWGMREVQSITHDEVQVWVSELAGLQVGDADFERQRIHVLRTVSEIRDYFVVGTPKTGQTRTVIFPSLLRPCLEGVCKGRQSSDLLFPDRRTGSYLRRAQGRYRGDWFCRAKHAVLDEDTAASMTVHDLRHPYVKHTTKNKSLQKQKSQTTNDNLIVWDFCFFDLCRAVVLKILSAG